MQGPLGHTRVRKCVSLLVMDLHVWGQEGLCWPEWGVTGGTKVWQAGDVQLLQEAVWGAFHMGGCEERKARVPRKPCTRVWSPYWRDHIECQEIFKIQFYVALKKVKGFLLFTWFVFLICLFGFVGFVGFVLLVWFGFLKQGLPL